MTAMENVKEGEISSIQKPCVLYLEMNLIKQAKKSENFPSQAQ